VQLAAGGIYEGIATDQVLTEFAQCVNNIKLNKMTLLAKTELCKFFSNENCPRAAGCVFLFVCLILSFA
jgi:hypothetical protein